MISNSSDRIFKMALLVNVGRSDRTEVILFPASDLADDQVKFDDRLV